MKALIGKVKGMVALEIAAKYVGNSTALMGEIWEAQDKLLAEILAKSEQEQIEYVLNRSTMVGTHKANARLWDMANQLVIHQSKKE